MALHDEFGSLAQHRALTIEKLNMSLGHVKALGASPVAAFLVCSLLFLLFCLAQVLFTAWLVVRTGFEMLLRMVLMPFLATWVTVDVLIIGYWYFDRVAEKLKEKKNAQAAG